MGCLSDDVETNKNNNAFFRLCVVRSLKMFGKICIGTIIGQLLMYRLDNWYLLLLVTFFVPLFCSIIELIGFYVIKPSSVDLMNSVLDRLQFGSNAGKLPSVDSINFNIWLLCFIYSFIACFCCVVTRFV